MCCLVEIGMFVFGIVTLVKGRFQLSRTKVVVGAPAYVIGAILTAVLPVVLAFCSNLQFARMATARFFWGPPLANCSLSGHPGCVATGHGSRPGWLRL